MRLETRFGTDRLIITPLDRRVDAHVAPALRAALIDRIEQGHRRLVINLREVEFIDSAGLGVLISVLKRVGRDGHLAVSRVSAQVRTVLELTQLNRVIPIED